nr:MAG TPA: hypothetical protein [Caudoviricetes sp.]
MKEKTYYEVLEEMTGRTYDNFEAQLDLGEKCLKDIMAIESRDTIKCVQRLVNFNGKEYEITIERWKGLENGINKL